MKQVVVHPQAEHESDLAFERYWAESELAAFRFFEEVQNAYGVIRRNPQSFPIHSLGTRRKVLDKFPFSIVFRELPDKIEIIADA